MSEQPDMDGREALAAEYALGVLDAAGRREAEVLIARDASFAASVARWRDQLAPAVELSAPVTPSTGLWDRIDAAIDPTPVRPERSGSFWSSLVMWRGLSFASTAAAAALAVMVVAPGPQAPAAVEEGGMLQAVARGPTLAAPVMMEGGSALVAAAYNPSDSMVIITPTGKYELTKTQSMELWIIVGDKAPRSLGIVDPRNPSLHQMPADVRAQLAAGAALAISIEPLGGSQTGAPTGPVVAQGKLTAI